MKPTLFLFDLDGTLTPPRQCMSDYMKKFLVELPAHIRVGVVTGSDYPKLQEQLGKNENFINQIDILFTENGVVGFKRGHQFTAKSIVDEIGEEILKKVINFSLKYIADLDIPIKRGTFIEFRKSMLNISPIGRNCTVEERNRFFEYDSRMSIRTKFKDALEKEFGCKNLQFSIGGQISIDVFPVGWDKSYCLNHIPSESYDKIHFFGDRTEPGGNDHELFIHPRVIPHTVTGPDDTCKQIEQIIMDYNQTQ